MCTEIRMTYVLFNVAYQIRGSVNISTWPWRTLAQETRTYNALTRRPPLEPRKLEPPCKAGGIK